jgi:hypothetical protein
MKDQPLTRMGLVEKGLFLRARSVIRMTSPYLFGVGMAIALEEDAVSPGR